MGGVIQFLWRMSWAFILLGADDLLLVLVYRVTQNRKKRLPQCISVAEDDKVIISEFLLVIIFGALAITVYSNLYKVGTSFFNVSLFATNHEG